MFVSLNRKIIYTILSLFLVTAAIFASTFYLVYGNKIQEEQLYSIQRNQQYIDLLFRSINFSREIKQLVSAHPEITNTYPQLKKLFEENSETNQINILSNEQKQVTEMRKSYDQRYEAIQESLKIFGISSILIIIAIISLGGLIRQWVLKPINKISAISAEVARGNLEVRIEKETKSKFIDELDYLIITFNKMLDNLQNVLSEVQEKEAFLQALIDS
ncbi:MAG: HAMP domain-containing protein, partial [Alphaproteobacteria bacterium]|nr:HAMP domain-containing protein [Alphaproteobacteria bacterium]